MCARPEQRPRLYARSERSHVHTPPLLPLTSSKQRPNAPTAVKRTICRFVYTLHSPSLHIHKSHAPSLSHRQTTTTTTHAQSRVSRARRPSPLPPAHALLPLPLPRPGLEVRRGRDVLPAGDHGAAHFVAVGVDCHRKRARQFKFFFEMFVR